MLRKHRRLSKLLRFCYSLHSFLPVPSLRACEKFRSLGDWEQGNTSAQNTSDSCRFGKFGHFSLPLHQYDIHGFPADPLFLKTLRCKVPWLTVGSLRLGRGLLCYLVSRFPTEITRV